MMDYRADQRVVMTLDAGGLISSFLRCKGGER